MNKHKLIETICAVISTDIDATKRAALAAHDAATNPESTAEDKYDTRALEASYLATAQSKRAAELEEILFACRAIPENAFKATDPIGVGALVQLQSGSRKLWVFLVGKGAGISVEVEGTQVQTITATSPIGEALLGLRQGDLCEVEQNNSTREYKVVSVQ